MQYTYRLHSISCLWFIFGILKGIPKKGLLRSLWVGMNSVHRTGEQTHSRTMRGVTLSQRALHAVAPL